MMIWLYICCIEYTVDWLKKFRIHLSENERLISQDDHARGISVGLNSLSIIIITNTERNTSIIERLCVTDLQTTQRLQGDGSLKKNSQYRVNRGKDGQKHESNSGTVDMSKRERTKETGVRRD